MNPISTNTPITALCIVKDPLKCPPNFTCITKTPKGEDADLWKDGWFGTKITRYLCFSTDPTESYNAVLVDACLGESRSVPNDFTIEDATRDTKEPVFKEKTLKLCYRTMPLVQTNQAIVEINVFASDATLPGGWQTIRIMNQLKLAFRAVSKREIIKDAELNNQNSHLVKGTTSIRTMRSNNNQNLDDHDPQNNTSLISSKGKRSGMTRVQGSSRARNFTQTTEDQPNTLQKVFSKTKSGPLDGLSFQVHKSVETGKVHKSNSFFDEICSFNYRLPQSLQTGCNFSLEEKVLREN